MNENSVKQALLEVVSLLRQITELMHRLLDIEQKHGFLKNIQHDKVFQDANYYDDLRFEVVKQNSQQPSKNKDNTNSSAVELNEHLISKGLMGRKRVPSVELF